MRLWHKDLIPVLPRQQLVAQYRECCSIAKDWDEKGKTNHVLINKVMDYSVCHLLNYTSLIKEEMRHRSYTTRKDAWDRFYNHCENIRERENPEPTTPIKFGQLYKDWHNDRYYIQCLYNLQEKYDCGGLAEDEWIKIAKSAAELKNISIL